MQKSFLKNKLIVSCQAVDEEPLNDAYIISKMAFACVSGGAEILRLSQYDHIKAAKKLVDVPIIGLIKQQYKDSEVFITPTIKEVEQLIELQVDVIAIDATLRKRPNDISLNNLVSYIKLKYPKQLIMADCSNIDDVKNAKNLEFDFIATTLRGHTKDTLNLSNVKNDFEFLKEIKKITNKPIVLEGGIWDIEQAKKAIEYGAYCVVVGSAITRPQLIVEKWMKGFKAK